VYLTRHRRGPEIRWALDGRYLPARFTLSLLLELPAADVRAFLKTLPVGEAADGDPLLPPVEPMQEIWASGVTYQRSREARRAESGDDLYDRVYDAERPELFLKAVGWRAVGPGEPVRIRRDSGWNVPEPELVLVLDHKMQVVGYTAGNDVSSRDIEGENALYLPQAKIYDRSCAIGPGIVLPGETEDLDGLEIRLRILRGGEPAFEDAISTSRMHRSFEELAAYLGRELSFPDGALLMTGTGIVPPDEFTLKPGDRTEISVGGLVLENKVTL
jgi:2-dehydro-3-deoxy-D-arabinonate dehydratase